MEDSTLGAVLITRASEGRKVKKFKLFLAAKRGVIVSGVPSVDRGNWGREQVILLNRFLPLRERRIIQIKNVLARITCYTFISYTTMSIVFGTGRSKRLSCLEARQVSKVYARPIQTR